MQQQRWLCEGFVASKNLFCVRNGKFNSKGHWYCGYHVPKSECSICLENLVKKEEIVLQCNHSFHTNCIHSWIKTGKFTCPLCRQKLPKELDIPWFCLNSVNFPHGYTILPPNHFELFHITIISFAEQCSLPYGILMILNYEEPSLFWEYTNLVRYWIITNQGINTDVICDTISRKFEPFAKKHKLAEFMMVSFGININIP